MGTRLRGAGSIVNGLPQLASVDEIATYLSLNRSTVNRMLRDGRLPGFKLGHRWYIRTEQLVASTTPKSRAAS